MIALIISVVVLEPVLTTMTTIISRDIPHINSIVSTAIIAVINSLLVIIARSSHIQ